RSVRRIRGLRALLTQLSWSHHSLVEPLIFDKRGERLANDLRNRKGIAGQRLLRIARISNTPPLDAKTIQHLIVRPSE
ncbi:MAG TPA: hypothetical protein VF210_09890, partial [Pseudomonadales bacterium]